MNYHTYRERDYAFGQAILTLRTSMSLTQVELARFLGISRVAVQGWEAGSSYPKAEHLKLFIALGVKLRAFPAGREEEEIRVLWKAAHQKVLLEERPPPLTLVAPQPTEGSSANALPVARSAPGRWVDWEDALDVPSFYWRQPELSTLWQWVVQERCRVVSVLGMGGIGKSALAVTLMHRLAEAPASLQGRLSLLLECMRKRRTLLVLDNLEVLLQEGERGGHYRPGYEGYGHVLRRMGETAHQSCLLLTSREKPADLVKLEGMHSPVRVLPLAGLEPDACEQLLADKELVGTPEERARLIQVYAGNPLALKIVAETIADLFAGEIGLFLKRGMVASVVWSPDGSRLASSGGSQGQGGSGEVLLWDAHSGERLHTFADVPSRMLAVDWSPRGDLLVSGGRDGMLRWWDVQSGKCVRMGQGHQGAVRSLRISPEGRRLASCGDDGAVKVWDLERGELRRTLRRDRPYERLIITGVKGLTEAQKATLRALGAVEEI